MTLTVNCNDKPKHSRHYNDNFVRIENRREAGKVKKQTKKNDERLELI